MGRETRHIGTTTVMREVLFSGELVDVPVEVCSECSDVQGVDVPVADCLWR